jgi:AcrR family transcriptional regulator
MKRARSDEAKEERRHALLRAARKRFVAGKPMSVAAIAKDARLAVGTVYLYFPTREAILAALLCEDLRDWVTALEAPSSEQLPDLLTRTLVERPHLVRMLAMLHLTIEQNLDAAGARKLKEELMAVVSRGASALSKKSLHSLDWPRFFLWLQAVVVGLEQMSAPSPVIATVLEDETFAPLRVDFARELRAILQRFLTP